MKPMLILTFPLSRINMGLIFSHGRVMRNLNSLISYTAISNPRWKQFQQTSAKMSSAELTALSCSRIMLDSCIVFEITLRRSRYHLTSRRGRATYRDFSARRWNTSVGGNLSKRIAPRCSCPEATGVFHPELCEDVIELDSPGTPPRLAVGRYTF